MKLLKGAIIFLLGAGAGAAGSYLYFKKKYDDRKEELDELKEYYMNTIAGETDKEVAETIVKEEKYISYDKLNEKEVKDVIKTVEKRSSVIDSPPEDYPNEPIVITEEDYSERELSFDKREIDYYMDDGAIVDENNELADLGDNIGYENLEQFINDESEDTMYIRNASSGSDYMVRKVYGNYSRTIGMGGDEYDD